MNYDIRNSAHCFLPRLTFSGIFIETNEINDRGLGLSGRLQFNQESHSAAVTDISLDRSILKSNLCTYLSLTIYYGPSKIYCSFVHLTFCNRVRKYKKERMMT